MAIAAPWWPFRKDMIQFDRDDPGVFELGTDADMVVYIGTAKEMRRRLREHLNGSEGTIKKNASKYRIEYALDYGRRERQLFDEHVGIYGKPPICNELATAAIPG